MSLRVVAVMLPAACPALCTVDSEAGAASLDVVGESQGSGSCCTCTVPCCSPDTGTAIFPDGFGESHGSI